jgi:hypothetical protein
MSISKRSISNPPRNIPSRSSAAPSSVIVQRPTAAIANKRAEVSAAPPAFISQQNVPIMSVNTLESVKDSIKVMNLIGNILSLDDVSMSKNTNETFVMGYDGKQEKKSYLEKLQIPNISSSNNIDLVAVLLTMLSNEFAISSGLGRLEGTPLGQTFGSQGDYIQAFLGANSILDSSNETSSVSSQSLADYIIVNEVGSNRVRSNDKKVLLLDGTMSKNTNNSINLFVNSVIKNPTSNNINSLESALNSAKSRFDSGFDFYKKLHLRDLIPDLLTPRGLFIRVMKDAANAMGALTGEGGSKQVAKELAIFSIISKFGKNNTDKNHPPNVLKRVILSFLVRKALASLVQKEFDPQGILKKSSGQKTGRPMSATGNVLEQAALDVLDSQNKFINSQTKIQTSTDRIRFSLDDSIIFDDESNSKIIYSSLNSLFDIETSTSDSNKKEITLSMGRVLEDSVNDNSSILNKIVQIFLDVHAEALASSKKENKNSTFLNSLFLTKNSQIDGTLSLAMILESMLLIFETFVDSSIPGNKKNEFNKIVMVDMIDGYANINIEVMSGPATKTAMAQKALISICAASQSNNLNSLYSGSNEDITIPDIDNQKPGTVISVSGNVSFQSIVDLVKLLSLERDFTAVCLSSAKAIFDYTSNQAEAIIQIGKQLRNDIQRNDRTKAYADFYEKSDYNKKYLNSYTDFDGYTSRNKLENYKKSLKSKSGRNPKITLGEFNAISAILKILSNQNETSKSNDTKLFISALFPSGFFSSSSITGKTIIPIDVQKSDMFGDTKYSSIRAEYFVNDFLSSKSFDNFSSLSENMTFDDILSRCMLDVYPTQISGSKFVSSFDLNQQKNAKEILRREIVSYLLSKMFSILSSVDLFHENLTDNNVFVKSDSSASIARIFSSAYDIDPSIFDECFVRNSKNEIQLDKRKLVDLTKNTTTESQSKISIQNSYLTFGEAELFHDVFSTVYFQSGLIQKNVFSTTYSDRIVGILTNSKEFSALNKSEPRRFDGVVRFDIYNLSTDKSLIRDI